MKSLLSLVILLLITRSPSARADDLPPEAREIWAAMSKLQTLRADFTLERTSSLLSRPLVSTGKIRFARPDRLAWVVEQPAPSTFIIDGATVAFSFPDQGMHQRVDLAGDPEMTRLIQGMLVWLEGDLDRVQRDYLMRWTVEDGVGTATLIPRDPTLAEMMGTMALHFPPGGDHALAVSLIEPDGDHTEISFQRTEINVELGEDAFQP